MRLLLLSFLLLGFTTANAATLVTDFNELEGAVGTFYSVVEGTEFEGGLKATEVIGGVVWADELNGPPQTDGISMMLNTSGEVTFERTDGTAFNLDAFTLSFLCSPETCSDLTLSGTKAAGGIVNQAYDLAGTGLDPALYESTTIATDDRFRKLTSFTFSGISESITGPIFIMDDIQTSVVPVPAAVWLFGSALAGLGWFRRRQTA